MKWALDFGHDAVECGRAIRVLSVVDAYTRECLALEVDTSLASRRVTRVLESIMAEPGQPGSQRGGRSTTKERPHSSLGYLTPSEFAARETTSYGKDAC